MSRDIRFVKVGNGQFPRIIVDSTVMAARDAAVTLAGLEVALAAALRDSEGEGRCLKCGMRINWVDPETMRPSEVTHCPWCGGILAPVAEGRGEGEK